MSFIILYTKFRCHRTDGKNVESNVQSRIFRFKKTLLNLLLEAHAKLCMDV